LQEVVRLDEVPERFRMSGKTLAKGFGVERLAGLLAQTVFVVGQVQDEGWILGQGRVTAQRRFGVGGFAAPPAILDRRSQFATPAPPGAPRGRRQ
jgi:hypothetical protein